MDLNLQTRCLTRRQLTEWSAFTLPKAALADFPSSVLAEIKTPLRVPSLTYEQVRTLERHGVFDDYRLKARRRDGETFVLWKPRRRGDTRLYTIHNMLVCRLAAWMLHAQLTTQEVVSLIRTSGIVSVTFASDNAEAVVAARFGRHMATGATADREGERVWRAEFAASVEQGYGLVWSFRVAYLGNRQTLRKIQKEIERAPVVRWNHEWQPAELHAEQQRASM